jgi:hypothetical protein
VTRENIEDWFSPVDIGEMDASRDLIMASALELANTILDHTPECADQTVSIRSIRRAVFWATEALLRG